jgi:transcription termination/antitermination protein NusG
MFSRPLFPGYVFVRFPPMQKVPVLSTPGVMRGGLGGAIPDVELMRIRAALQEGYKLSPHVDHPTGMRVRFRNGPFSGKEGIATKIGVNLSVVLVL